MRQVLTTLAEVCGFTVAVIGVAIVSLPGALVVAGGGIFAAGVLLGGDG